MASFIKRIVQIVVEGALMPTGKNLVPALISAMTITVGNILLRLLGFPVVLDWRGCLLAVLVLVAVLIIERSEYDEVSKLYRDVELRVKDIASRQSTTRTSRKDAGTNNLPIKSKKDDSQ